MNRFGRSFAFLLLVSSHAALATGSPITISFHEKAVRAAGVTPGGQAICFSISHLSRTHDFSIVRNDVVVIDEDADGTVECQAQSAAFNSLWIVGDLSDGRLGIASPSGMRQQIPLREVIGVRSGTSGQLTELAIRQRAAEILLIRPGAGAWRAKAFEGGRRDRDGANNGLLSLGVDQLSTVSGAHGAPTHLRPEDIIILIEPRRMEFTTFRVGTGKEVH
jgi:hypothetical protein